MKNFVFFFSFLRGLVASVATISDGIFKGRDSMERNTYEACEVCKVAEEHGGRRYGGRIFFD